MALNPSNSSNLEQLALKGLTNPKATELGFGYYLLLLLPIVVSMHSEAGLISCRVYSDCVGPSAVE